MRTIMKIIARMNEREEERERNEEGEREREKTLLLFQR